MANEITAHCSLRYVEGTVDKSVNNGSFSADVTGTDYALQTQIATTSPAALDKGNVTVPGWLHCRNTSSVAGEIIRLKTSTSGVVFAKILPGKELLLYWDENLTAPFILSDAGSPILEYFLVEA